MDETVTHVFQPTMTMRRSARGWTVEMDFSGSYVLTDDPTPGHVEQYEGGPEADRAAADLDAWLGEHAETLFEIAAADNPNKPTRPTRLT